MLRLTKSSNVSDVTVADFLSLSVAAVIDLRYVVVRLAESKPLQEEVPAVMVVVESFALGKRVTSRVFAVTGASAVLKEFAAFLLSEPRSSGFSSYL